MEQKVQLRLLFEMLGERDLQIKLLKDENTALKQEIARLGRKQSNEKTGDDYNLLDEICE